MENQITTIGFYDTVAENYCSESAQLDMSKQYSLFLKHLPPAAYILDAGCGSGRDTVNFIRHGYNCDAFDGSVGMATAACVRFGITVQIADFRTYKACRQYDGIWASASLLHLDAESLEVACANLLSLLKVGGFFYMSFRYGDLDRVSPDGRFYHDMTPYTACKFFEDKFPNVSVIELDTDIHTKKGRANGQWLNVVIKKDA